MIEQHKSNFNGLINTSHTILISEKAVRFLPDNCKRLVVLLMVHTHDKHGSISAGGRDDDSLGTALQVSLQCILNNKLIKYFGEPLKIVIAV